LSSTFSDLARYREAVEGMVQEFGEMFVGMEHFGARPQPSLDTCLEEVTGSDVVLVLAGGRYGSLTDTGTSFTQREVERAQDRNIPILVFIQEDPAPAPSKADAQRQRAFVRSLEARYTYAHFRDEASLVTTIAAALRRMERPLDVSTHSEAWRELLDRARVAADWDCVSLSAHNVDHLYSVDCVAADHETTIRRPIVSAGGSGANTLAGLGRMGLKVAAAGAVGCDQEGEDLRTALAADDVQALLAPMKEKNVATGKTIVFSDQQGRRSIYVDPGANARFAHATNLSHMSELQAAVHSARIVHFSSFTHSPERALQEKLLRQISEQAILSLTPGALYCKLGLDRLSPLLMRANVVFLYEQQLDMLLSGGREDGPAKGTLEEKVGRLYEWKRLHRSDEPLVVVIKNASSSDSATTSPQQLRGLVGRTAIETNQPTQAPAVGAPVRGRDSTGAGDASAAGLLWAILQTQPFNYAMDLAYVFARSASSELGGRAGLPTPGQLRHRWQSWIGSSHSLPT
jgi:ribokinase